MMTTVLFVAASPKYGGTEKHLLDLVGRLERADTQVSIVCTGKDVFSTWLSTEQRSRIPVTCVPHMTSVREWLGFFRSRNPDVVVLVTSWIWCFPWYTLFAAWLARIRKRYVIAHLPPSPVERPGFLGRWRYRLSHRRLGLFCTATICVSEFIRRRLVEDCLFSAARTLVIQNGVSLSMFHPDEEDRVRVRGHFGISAETVCLVCVASLVQQ